MADSDNEDKSLHTDSKHIVGLGFKGVCKAKFAPRLTRESFKGVHRAKDLAALLQQSDWVMDTFTATLAAKGLDAVLFPDSELQQDAAKDALAKTAFILI